METKFSATDREIFKKIVNARRTSKAFDGSEVPREKMEELVSLAVLAPNHRLNQPWRFRICSKDFISKWIQFLKSSVSEEELKSLGSTLSRLEGVGGLIYVCVLRDDEKIVDEENFAAASAAVQNILLAACSMNLLSFWSSNKAMRHSNSQKFLGVKDEERFVGAIWLGHGELPAPKARKGLDEVSEWMVAT